MLSREHFIFTIGYDGPVAVVDSQGARRYGTLSTVDLAKRGLFRAAWASAVFSGSAEEKALVIEAYNKAAGASYGAEDSLDRLFGIFPVTVKRLILL
ncbi:MAG: hypothetical protein LBE02_00265 [Spirochaetaceae bacterium]|jgi:hypothetical protein|nr:hypothetical protein [Spirochaetaceae bacterium]